MNVGDQIRKIARGQDELADTMDKIAAASSGAVRDRYLKKARKFRREAEKCRALAEKAAKK